MRLRNAFLLPMLVFLLHTASAQDSGFGAGIILGEPTGVSLKLWQSETTALDCGIAWAFGDNGSFHVHGDYLWHEYDLIHVSSGRMPVYYGVGARARLGDNTRLGVRGVAGLAYMFDGAPVDLFIEIAPVFDLIEKTEFAVNGGIGARYYF